MKKRYLFLIIIICLLAISAVNAEEISNRTDDVLCINNDNSGGTRENILNIDINGDIVSESNKNWYINVSTIENGDGSQSKPYNNFKSLIENNNLKNGDNIYFASGIYVGENNINITINKNLNLFPWDTGEVIFDAQNKSSIFLINSNKINITGITFINGNGYHGGAICFNNTISNSKIEGNFLNNHAKVGGALSFNGVTNSCINGSFLNNNAEVTMFVRGTGGAIHFSNICANNTIDGLYRNNYACYGGAIHFTTEVEHNIILGKYINNIAIVEGGALRFSRDANNNKINGTFTSNNVQQGAGGAILFNKKANNNIIDGLYINNNVTRSGGAIFFYIESLNNTISGDYIGNYAKYHGGAISFYHSSSSNNIDGNYTNNTAIKNGGAIYFDYTVIKNNISGIYMNNHADYGGALYFNDTMENNNLNATYINNTAKNNGGAILFSISNNNKIYGTYVYNRAKYGGALHFQNNTVNNTILGIYTANNVKYYGGAILFSGYSFNNKVNGTYICNVANNGAVIGLSSCKNNNIFGWYFNNIAKSNGGVFYLTSGISNNTLNGYYINNTADNYGGTFYIDGASKNIISGVFSKNYAKFGGIIHFESGSKNHVYNSIFLNNDCKNVISSFESESIRSNVDYCWFGNNISNFNEKPNATFEIKNWLFLNGTASSSEPYLYRPYLIKFKLLAYNDTSKLISDYNCTKLPTINLTITAINGFVNMNEINFNNDLIYTASNVGSGSITANIENVYCTIKVNNTNSGDFDKLQFFINEAKDNTIIDLTQNYTYSIGLDNITEGIYINKRNLTINGNGFTIDAKGKTRIFNVLGENVTLMNIYFKNGNTLKNGAVIYFNNTGTVRNCNFTNNSNAVISFSYSKGTIINCTFNSNHNAISIDKGNIINCNFASNNHAIRSTNFGRTNVVNCNFVNNCHAITFECGNGNVVNCTFVNHTNVCGGGAIYSGSDPTPLPTNVTNCTFVNNSAIDEYDCYGGAIYLTSGRVVNCSFENNYVYGEDYGAGGAIYFGYGGGTVINCSFVNNSAKNNGGDTYWYMPCSDGGAIYFSSVGTVINCIFVNNKAKDYAGYGGAIYFNGNSNIIASTVNNCIFVNNTAFNEGDAIYSKGSEVNIYINNNWWGVNNPNWNILLYNIDKPSCFAILNVTANPTEIYSGEKSDIVTKFVWNGTDTDATILLPRRNIKLITNGTLTKTDGDVGLTSEFSATRKGIYYVNATVDNEILGVNVKVTGTGPADASVSAENMELKVGENGTISYTTSPSGLNVSFVPDDSGVVSVNETTGFVTALKNGTAQITINVGDNEKYALNSTVVTVTVNKIVTEITVENATLSLNVSDEVATGAALTPAGAGNVTYTVSNSSVVKVENGKIIAVSKGTATITVSFPGNNKYAEAKDKTIQITVLLRDSSVSVLNNTVDLNVDDKYTINPITSPNGLKITYESNNASIVNVNRDGIVTACGEGNAIITLTVGDDVEYIKNSTTIKVTVNKIPTKIVVTDNNLTLNISDETTINPTTRPDGLKVTYESTDDSIITVDSNGKIKAISNGTALITIKFEETYKYKSSESTLTVNVNPKEKENATVSIDAPSEVTVGDNVTVTVTLPKDATGSVTIGNEVVTLVNGTARAVLTNLPVGNNTVPVTYSGDYHYNSLMSNISFMVNKISNYNITAENLTIYNDQPAEIVVNVPSDATGNILFRILSQEYILPVIDGEARVIISDLSGYSMCGFFAFLVDDQKYELNSVYGTITILPKVSNYTIYSPGVDVYCGETANITVYLPHDATGRLKIWYDDRDIGYVYINEGVATFEATYQISCVHTYDFYYEGDYKYTPKSTSVVLTVHKFSDYQFNTSDVYINSGETANIIANLPSDATGTAKVRIFNDDFASNYTATVYNGQIIINEEGLTKDSKFIIDYLGNYKYEPKSVSGSIFVKRNIIIDASDVTKYYHGLERFVVTVKEDNLPVVGKDVTINLNGVPYTRTTDNNGVASMAINLESGVYNVTSEYDGIMAYSKIIVKTTIESSDITKIFRNGTQYYATFRDSNGNLLRNTDVNFNINGVFYTRTTDSNGVARMNINLLPKQYVLTAMNPVSGESCGNLINVLPNIVENYDLTKYYKNASKFTFRLLDNQGNPVGAGVSASLNINGVFYTRTTDVNGYINMNINLNPGTYIATIMYNGLSLANTIKVLPILEAKDVVMKYRDGTKFEAKLLDGQGKPFTGQTLMFNINGVMYNRITGDDGIARLNINLMPGEYIITSMYSNGATIANKVTIRS